MKPQPRRLSILALVLALLVGIAGFPGTALADPLEIPLPSHNAEDGALGNDARTETYYYPTLKHFWEALEWPDSELSDADLVELGLHKNYEFGTKEHFLTGWRDDKEARDVPDWKDMEEDEQRKELSGYIAKYVGISNYRLRGSEFEVLLGKLFGYPNLGFVRGKKLPNVDQDQDKDWFGDWLLFDDQSNLQVAIEAKSGFSLDRPQADNYGKLVAAGVRVIYIFGMEPKPADVNYLLNKGIEVYIQPSNGVEYKYGDPPPDDEGGTAPVDPTPPAPVPPVSPTGPGQQATNAALDDALMAVPSSPEDAEAWQRVAEQFAEDFGETDLAGADLTTDQLGGVDFSSLEMRYVADTYNGGLGSGIDYAYSLDAAASEEASYGGREAAGLATDAFFTWLALPTDTFWVNLNPDEPDRIIDEQFGTTDAGRVLLEADLQMKKSVAEFIHPDSELGGEYWDALQGDTKCISMRQWIVPRPAVVHENGDELFILDAPLEVKMEGEYLESEGVGGTAGCSGQSPEDTDHNEGVYAELILPKVEEAVNTAPEFADLRRVYASRVAAEWYRQRSETKTTAYSDIIDSGDVSAWPARSDWDPKDVFDAYVRSYEEGEFNVERETREGDYIITHTYIYGGVTFFDVPSEQVGATEFAAQYPDLAATAGNALSAPAFDEGAGTLWFGGRSSERPPWNPYPTPGSPLSNPWFWMLSTLPVATWLAVGVFLWWRRRPSAESAQPPVPTGSVAS